jgi:hypothetical protein
MSVECKYFQFYALIGMNLFLQGAKEKIDMFHITGRCLYSLLNRERLHDSTIREFANYLKSFFPYAEIGPHGLKLYMSDHPELSDIGKDGYVHLWKEKYDKRTALRKSLKTKTVSSYSDFLQIEEKKILFEIADSLKKYFVIEKILNENENT